MEADPLEERLRTVYQKDLYDDYFSMNVRIESDELEHGDKIHVIIRKPSDRATETPNSKEEGEDKSTFGEFLRSTVGRLRNLNYGR